MITKWMQMQERWAAEQTQRHADFVSLFFDTDWDDWATIDRRTSGFDFGTGKRRKNNS